MAGLVMKAGISVSPHSIDVTRNQVVILNEDHWSSKIILHNNVVDSFYFLNHPFIRLKSENHDFYYIQSTFTRSVGTVV